MAERIETRTTGELDALINGCRLSILAQLGIEASPALKEGGHAPRTREATAMEDVGR